MGLHCMDARVQNLDEVLTVHLIKMTGTINDRHLENEWEKFILIFILKD